MLWPAVCVRRSCPKFDIRKLVRSMARRNPSGTVLGAAALPGGRLWVPHADGCHGSGLGDGSPHRPPDFSGGDEAEQNEPEVPPVWLSARLLERPTLYCWWRDSKTKLVLDNDESAELFDTPAEAVRELFGAEGHPGDALRAWVELRSAGSDRKRERTIVFRDLGIGMQSNEIADSLLRVGSSRKDGVVWLMGAFGRGGLTVLPNAYGWVVLTRSALAAESGVVLTVVRWQRVGNRQTQTALYRVVPPWQRDGDRADPLVIPAAVCPDFDCGTRIAVVGFRAEGIGVSRLGDERSLDTIVDIRLFEPPLPIHLTAPVPAAPDAAGGCLRSASLVAKNTRHRTRPSMHSFAKGLPPSEGSVGGCRNSCL